MELLFYALIGIAAGILSGMGIGGGTLLIPALTFFMGYGQQQAQGLNLLFFLPAAAVAVCTHWRNGNIEKGMLPKLIIPGVLAAVLGSVIAVKIDAQILRRLFGGFLFIVGMAEFFRKNEDASQSNG
jgi:hypothetical protein